MTRIKNGLMGLFSFLSFIVYMNLLWLLFSLMGLGIFGVGPATVALFNVFQNYQENKVESGIKEFWSYYKFYFKKANLIQCLFYTFFLIILLNYRISIVYLSHALVFQVIYLSLFITLCLIYLFLLPSVMKFPNSTIRETMRFAIFLTFRFPLKNLTLALGIFGCLIVVSLKSAFLLFFSASLPVFIVLYLYRNLVAQAKVLFPQMIAED